MDRAGDQLMLLQVAKAETLPRLEDDPWGPHQLGDDHPLGAVDDERALARHHGEIPHEHGLFFDLARLGVHEPGPHEDGGREGHVLLFAFLHRELGRRSQIFVVGIELQLQLQTLGKVLDRADIRESLGQPAMQEPLETLALDGDQIGQLKYIIEVGEGVAVPKDGVRGQGWLL